MGLPSTTSREQYDKLNEAVKEMDTPFRSAEDVISSLEDQFLEKYDEYPTISRK